TESWPFFRPRYGSQAPSSGAPPDRARSSILIVSGFSLPAAFVMRSKVSSNESGSASLGRKRIGLTRATTKLLRYGLVRPRAFNASTFWATRSSSASTVLARAWRASNAVRKEPYELIHALEHRMV